jgi:hypothetical protein
MKLTANFESAAAGLALFSCIPAASSPLFGQCAMCYQTAAASGPQGIHALNLGILALLLPLASLVGCFAVAAYRHRR